MCSKSELEFIYQGKEKFFYKDPNKQKERPNFWTCREKKTGIVGGETNITTMTIGTIRWEQRKKKYCHNPNGRYQQYNQDYLKAIEYFVEKVNRDH